MNVVIEQSKNLLIDLSILKAHLRIDHEHEDKYLQEILGMATEILEKSIKKSILKKKYKYIFQSNHHISSQEIEIPLQHVRNVLSVKKIITKSNKEKVEFSTKNSNGRTFVLTNYSKYPIEIIYSAGLTDKSEKIPSDLQYAVLQIAKNIYDCSEESILNNCYIKNVIDSYKYLSIN
jgi:uncharacterized phiE125 gp8 family phage protein